MLLNSLGLNAQEKFAILAIKNVRAEIDSKTPIVLPDGTRVLTEFRGVLDAQPHWKEWLGSLRIERLGQANVVLVRSEQSPNPEILDNQHVLLGKYMSEVLYVLRLALVLEYDGADMLLGSFLGGEAQVRQVSEVPGFRPSRGSEPNPVTIDALIQAAGRAGQLQAIESEYPKFARFIRGLNILVEGLRLEYGQDRIHEFVRSLEALILPDAGRTRRQFIHRCQTFAKAGATAEQVLGEAFDMRSDTEHLNEWDSALNSYPVSDRENVASQRLRQAERLACFAYCKIFDDSALRRHFETELSLRQFWSSTDDATRKRTIGDQFDLNTVPMVRDYDGYGRPTAGGSSGDDWWPRNACSLAHARVALECRSLVRHTLSTAFCLLPTL